MAGKLRAEMLRPLTLSPHETQMIIAEAERILSETLAASELFIANDRNLPAGDWKLVKTKESVRVYRKRKHKHTAAAIPSGKRSSDTDSSTRSTRSTASADTFVSDSTSAGSTSSSIIDSRGQRIASTTSSSSSSSSCASSDSNTISETEHSHQLDPAAACEQVSTEINRSKPAARPLVVATGIVPGRVEDVAFGALAHTERVWRHRDVHLQDECTDMKILASISWPTAEDPFRSLTVKWSMDTFGPLARTRDCVYIEANGMATNARGERVAYNLSHSLDLDCIARIPSFKHLDVVRVNLSMCYISRQHDRSSIEVFCRGFADPGGVLVDSIANAVFTDMVLSIVHVVDCAYVKKLVWLAHAKRRERLSGDDDDIALLSRDDNVHRCVSCRLAALGRLLGVIPAACQVCRRQICGKCRVTKKVPVEPSSSGASSSSSSSRSVRVKTKRVTFCLCCIVEATRAPTHDVAAAMVQLVHDEWTWQAFTTESDMSRK